MEPLGSFLRVLNVLPREKIEGPSRDFHRIGPLGQFDLVVAMSVVCLCGVCVVSVPFRVVYFEAHFAPTSRSRMSDIFRDSEFLGKSAGKKWSQN